MMKTNPVTEAGRTESLELDRNACIRGDDCDHVIDVAITASPDERHAKPANRKGTISSACFNLLSTMVGGGSLALPLAFQQAGNGLVAPLVLILTTLITGFIFRILVESAPSPNHEQRGENSFESISYAAFGSKARVATMLLIFFMCFFGNIGYAVLLRDMLEPISDAIRQDSPRTTRNLGMLAMVLLVTPLYPFSAWQTQVTGISSFCPSPPRMLLNSAPLFISCFVCHYNVHPVHNDLKDPTPRRVSRWIRLTTWSAASYYMAIGFSGSLYAACTPDGHITGNILLSFDDSDPLLLVGRLCLAMTITLALPMLTIPARDIVLRSFKEHFEREEIAEDINLEEQLSVVERGYVPLAEGAPPPMLQRLAVAIVVLWSSAGVACCVSSINVVLTLVGSSLSILLSFLLPCGSYLVLVNGGKKNSFSRFLSFTLLGIFVPLMFVSTGNAIANTFFGQ
ncbi:transmembrane amino acid transporter protein [Fragilaria crotonensis]|nr:transmembrane amino acid transporter protein [Fragilaria crotonensis]